MSPQLTESTTDVTGVIAEAALVLVMGDVNRTILRSLGAQMTSKVMVIATRVHEP